MTFDYEGPRAVPDRQVDDPYGYVEFLADTTKPPLRLTIGVQYGEDDPGTDIVLSSWGVIEQHPYDVTPRDSTEDERAAVGWTW